MAAKKDWRKALIPPHASIHEAIKGIDTYGLQIALVVDSDNRLLGTVTDGDIRRAILRGKSMDAPVEVIMNKTPRVAGQTESRDQLLSRMAEELVRHFPLIDDEERVVDLAYIEDLMSAAGEQDCWVVIMAGGPGTRLRPLTENAPKPLLQVGDKPLLETIIETFLHYNFRRFYLSVNYKAMMIKKHFGDGSRWNATIRYIYEDQRLGTAGSLRLLPERPNSPLIIMNGDLLTRLNFQHLLDYHRQQGSKATMCVCEYDFQVPFGVVQIENNHIKRIDEKPIQSFFVNAGIYVLEPELIDLIPTRESYDMPAMFEHIIAAGHAPSVFPIREYWLDIGRLDDFQRANDEFHQNFK